jgi:hypothetical protein
LTVNNRTIDATEFDLTLLIQTIKSNIENIKKNYIQNYVLCGLIGYSTNDIVKNFTEIQNVRFPLVFSASLDGFTMNTIKSIIKSSINALNPNTLKYQTEIVFSNSFKKVGILSNFNKNLSPHLQKTNL